MKPQAQSKREMLIEKVIETIKEFGTKEGGLTYADLESLFGRNSGFMTAFSAIAKITF